jgi:hypothetical protein
VLRRELATQHRCDPNNTSSQQADISDYFPASFSKILFKPSLKACCVVRSWERLIGHMFVQKLRPQSATNQSSYCDFQTLQRGSQPSSTDHSSNLSFGTMPRIMPM